MSIRRGQLDSRLQGLGEEYQRRTAGEGGLMKSLRWLGGGQGGWVNREYWRRYGISPRGERIKG